MNKKSKQFTRWVSLGWWLSLAFFIVQGFVIDCLCLSATPWLGLFLFAGATILTFASLYDKRSRFSPYKGILELFKK